MDTNDLAAKGLKLRKELFGDKAVEQRMNAFGEFGPATEVDFQLGCETLLFEK